MRAEYWFSVTHLLMEVQHGFCVNVLVSNHQTHDGFFKSEKEVRLVHRKSFHLCDWEGFFRCQNYSIPHERHILN